MGLVSIFEHNYKVIEVHRNNKDIKILGKEFDNYFYALVNDIKVIERIIKELNVSDYVTISTEVFKTIDNREVKKIVCSLYFNKFRYELKNRNIELFESDLSVYTKYVIDNKIKYDFKRRIFFIDIETLMGNEPFMPEKEILAICIYDNLVDEYIIWAFNEEYTRRVNLGIKVKINILKTEIEMIDAFFEYVGNNHPDIIAGWYSNDFDMPYIINRARYLKLNVNKLALLGAEVTCEKRGDRLYLDIPGISCLDLIPILERITAYMPQPPSFDLSTVCNFFLGEKYFKFKINIRDYKNNYKQFLNYNLNDVYLLKILDDNMGMLNYALTMQCDIVSIRLETCTFNSYILETFLKFKYPEIILLDKKDSINVEGTIVELRGNNFRIKVKGAFTGKMVEVNNKIDFINPDARLFKNVEVLDFSGMYSSIYSTFNLSFDTYKKEGGELVVKDVELDIQKKDGNKYTTIKSVVFTSTFDLDKQGFIPMFITEIRRERKKYKTILKTIDKNKDKILYQKNKCLEDVMKLISNAAFGLLSFNNFRLFNPYINGTITKLARDCLVFINKECEQLGVKYLYSDTDSIFIWDDNKKIDIKNIIIELNKRLKEHVISINPKLEKNYNIELEHAYNCSALVFSGVKKKYFGIKDTEDFFAKNFEIIKRSTPQKIKPILKELFLLLLEGDIMKVKLKIKEIKEKMSKLNIYDIGVNLNISRNLDDYKTKVQHIEGAKYSNKYLNTHFDRGDKVKMIFVKSTPIKYPTTKIICIDDDTEIPEGFEIDYNRFFDLLILKKLKLLENVKCFNIQHLISPNKSLLDFSQELIKIS